jgi:hypothetical protein
VGKILIIMTYLVQPELRSSIALLLYGVMQPVLRRTVAGALRYGVNTLFAPLKEQSVCGALCAIVHNGSRLCVRWGNRSRNVQPTTKLKLKNK